MILAFQFCGLLLCFCLGILCIRDPMKMANMLAAYARFIFGEDLLKRSKKSELREALILIKENPSEYQKRYALQIVLIRQSGYIAIFVSIVGACILTLANN